MTDSITRLHNLLDQASDHAEELKDEPAALVIVVHGAPVNALGLQERSEGLGDLVEEIVEVGLAFEGGKHTSWPRQPG